jgi:uncharacterized protein involved in exopolysaccharide biosynthesis
VNSSTDKRVSGDLGSEIDVAMLVRTLWRRKWLIGAVSFAVAVLAAVYSLLVTPIYRAEVIVIDARQGSMGAAASLASQFGGLASLAGIDLAGDNNMREARSILKSRSLVEEFIVKNKLTDTVMPKAKVRSTWRAVEHFRRSILTVREDSRTGTIGVAIHWKDPKVAAAWANDFVGMANEIVRTRALDEANRNIDYLNEQMKNTSSIEVQRVMYRLIETETKNRMLASGRPEFAFTVVDAATAPERRLSPKRTLITMAGGMLGFVLGSLFVLIRERTRSAR